MSPPKAIGRSRKWYSTTGRFVRRSGPFKRAEFSDVPWTAAAASQTKRILFGFFGFSTTFKGRYHTLPGTASSTSCAVSLCAYPFVTYCSICLATFSCSCWFLASFLSRLFIRLTAMG
uniref:(northern house mosquito) hypothetical protein n=1 Tax=Culex pipiens TaxID=7175 RepID=A0A8D8AJG4_CULPI